ncbi:hypothetical protein [Streptomyces sp. NBC_00988]|uniref:hypothetical protein n=1 Tax=Streptomyces sp. NBC_00988 TaxID=2903704 RepID=UPI00386C79EA
MTLREVAVSVPAQVVEAIVDAMFGEPLVKWSTHDRSAGHLLLGEVVATAGLILLIFGLACADRVQFALVAVAFCIGAAYWFMSSTSFADPAVTIGAFTDSFAGIAPGSILGFIGMQLVDEVVELALVALVFMRREAREAGKADWPTSSTDSLVRACCICSSGSGGTGMRRWAGGWVVVGMVILAACSSSAGGGSAGGPSGSSSAGSSTGAPTHTSAAPSATPTEGSPPTSSASAESCVAGHVNVTVSPGDAVEQRLCVRPGTVVSLVLKSRTDDKRWTVLLSSAPVFVVVAGWQPAKDGSARASLRCAGTRGGIARITAMAKVPDVAGAARVVFTLYVSVVPYPRQG